MDNYAVLRKDGKNVRQFYNDKKTSYMRTFRGRKKFDSMPDFGPFLVLLQNGQMAVPEIK